MYILVASMFLRNIWLVGDGSFKKKSNFILDEKIVKNHFPHPTKHTNVSDYSQSNFIQEAQPHEYRILHYPRMNVIKVPAESLLQSLCRAHRVQALIWSRFSNITADLFYNSLLSVPLGGLD